MKQSKVNLYFSPKVILVAFILLFSSLKATAQEEEVLLTFRHPAIGNVYINCLYNYKSEAVFLPVMELFSLLEINYQPDMKNFSVRGNFIIPDNPYTINLSTQQMQLGKTIYPLKSDDFRLRETDFYLSPKVLEEIFGLKFTVELAPLLLKLETTLKLPVEDRKTRELIRSRIEGSELNQDNFPLGYDRKRSILNGTMLDYAITGDYTKEIQSLGYTFTGGMEILGGDIQGTVNGSNSSNGIHSLNANGLRWRYAMRDNNYLSGIMLGQTYTTGLQPMSIKGLALTNDPVEPRQMYETYVVDGNTEPNSEVEIYVNERLTDFKRANELGYYRFNVPITYGTTRMSLHIYTPSGQLIVNDRQMQVPFTFLPQGVVSYNIQAGQVDAFLSDSIQDQWVGHANVAVGLTNWLTTSVGSQFLGNNFSSTTGMYYGSLSARIAKQYMVNIDLAPTNFYRFTGSVMYANNLSVNLMYTIFDGTSLFNSRGETDNLTANVYVPFNVFGLNTGLRISGEHIVLPSGNLTNFNSDLSARLGKVNLRFNYRDNFETSSAITQFGKGVLTTALTYTIARTPGIPVFVRGMYVRLQNTYNVYNKLFLESAFELSRSLFKTGRLDINMTYSHLNNSINTQVGLTLDLTKVRSTTTVNATGKKVAARQSLNGSLGWDMPNGAITASNRQQVGRSAASVVLFIDNNNSGHYDAGDQLLPYRGVKLDRTATMEVGRDSILRLSQLQSYYKYNLSVNRTAIPDPTLVPLKDKFSFIADPNQYKRIEIPFYRGGTVQGAVLIQRNGITTGQGGLRLLLKAVNKDFNSVVRTMSDGGFYIMDLAPWKYTIEVDTVQLSILNVKQPEKLSFEIKARAEGDFIEGLNIILIPVDSVPSGVKMPLQKQTTNEIKKSDKVDLQQKTSSVSGIVPINRQNGQAQLVENHLKIKTSNNKKNKTSIVAKFTAKSKAEVNQTVKTSIPKSTILAPTSAIPETQATLWATASSLPVLTVIFPFNSSYPTPVLKHYLDSMSILLKNMSWQTLTIYGNTDSTGPSDYNKWISLKRANQVKNYLVHKKIPENKIITIGNGEEKPISSDTTIVGNRLNRRIDFELSR